MRKTTTTQPQENPMNQIFTIVPMGEWVVFLEAIEDLAKIPLEETTGTPELVREKIERMFHTFEDILRKAKPAMEMEIGNETKLLTMDTSPTKTDPGAETPPIPSPQPGLTPL